MNASSIALHNGTALRPDTTGDKTGAVEVLSLLSFRRVRALVVKESRQIIRDASSIAVGIVLPAVLILLFGYGLSLDVKNIPIAVALEDSSPDAAELLSAFALSPYFKVRTVSTMTEAQELMLARKVDGVVRIRSDFSRLANQGAGEVQILVHGSDANQARIVQSYAEGAVGQWTARQLAEGKHMVAGPVNVQARAWFNESYESRFFLVPGLIVLIMTLIGSLLTALVMAREWERGTLEALFVTPVRVIEIIAGKLIPYFVLGVIGLVLCVASAKLLFHLPFRGSIAILGIVSVLYLLVALGIGLLISSVLRNQFLASLVTVLAAFLPAVMLSGFLFDIRSEPVVVQFITYLFPARYFVTLLQTILLVGNVWSVILPNAAVLAGMAAALMAANLLVTRKKLA
jgi:ABC-2 type transport system permease protein